MKSSAISESPGVARLDLRIAQWVSVSNIRQPQSRAK
jgi:hypothetical protein